MKHNGAMNHRGGLALVRATWFSWLQYRSFFFLLAFGWMVPPLISLFLWTAAAGEGTVGGMDRGAFSAYYLLVILVNQLTYAQVNWTVGDVIRYGGLNAWLLRPIPPLYNALASEAAGKLVYMLFTFPVVALLALIFKPALAISLLDVLLFLPALALAWVLRTFWGLWVALLAFWATRADALLAVQDSLVFLLAGVVAPVSLLPTIMQPVAVILPFRYMISFPVEILSGHLTFSEALLGFTIQLGWTALALALSWLVWQRGIKRYSAIGG